MRSIQWMEFEGPNDLIADQVPDPMMRGANLEQVTQLHHRHGQGHRPVASKIR